MQEEALAKPKKTYPAALLTNLTFKPTGEISLFYQGYKKPLVQTPAEVSSFPLSRIPLFNILRSDSPWKPVVQEWFNLFLNWKVEFFVQGDIDPVKEEAEWRKNLRLGKTASLSFGTKGEVVPDRF